MEDSFLLGACEGSNDILNDDHPLGAADVIILCVKDGFKDCNTFEDDDGWVLGIWLGVAEGMDDSYLIGINDGSNY